MVSVNPSTQRAVEKYFRERLPKDFVMRLHQTICNGYDGAIGEGPSHIVKRRRATDRYWAIQEAWANLGQETPDMRVIEAEANNGGGPYFALEYRGTLLTIHKVDDEDTPPRRAEYRSGLAKEKNEPYQMVMTQILDQSEQVIDKASVKILENIQQDLTTGFDLYILVTHRPNAGGDQPEFINEIVTDSFNHVLACVDVIAEAKALVQNEMVEVQVATTIPEPTQMRRRRRKVVSE